MNSLYTVTLWVIFQPDVAALSADDYAAREAAEARLTRWVDLTWPLLDRNFDNAEQRRRARRVLERAVPRCYPPIAVLSGRPVAEWVRPGCSYSTIGRRPSPAWHLGYLQPDRRGS